MELKSIKLDRREKWEPHPGAFYGSAKFSSDLGTVYLNLDEDACRQIIGICAQHIVKITSDVATQLTAETLMQTTSKEPSHEA